MGVSLISICLQSRLLWVLGEGPLSLKTPGDRMVAGFSLYGPGALLVLPRMDPSKQSRDCGSPSWLVGGRRWGRRDADTAWEKRPS